MLQLKPDVPHFGEEISPAAEFYLIVKKNDTARNRDLAAIHMELDSILKESGKYYIDLTEEETKKAAVQGMLVSRFYDEDEIPPEYEEGIKRFEEEFSDIKNAVEMPDMFSLGEISNNVWLYNHYGPVRACIDAKDMNNLSRAVFPWLREKDKEIE